MRIMFFELRLRMWVSFQFMSCYSKIRDVTFIFNSRMKTNNLIPTCNMPFSWIEQGIPRCQPPILLVCQSWKRYSEIRCKCKEMQKAMWVSQGFFFFYLTMKKICKYLCIRFIYNRISQPLYVFPSNIYDYEMGEFSFFSCCLA